MVMVLTFNASRLVVAGNTVACGHRFIDHGIVGGHNEFMRFLNNKFGVEYL